MRLFNVILVRFVLFLIRKISLKPQQQLSSLCEFARKRVQVAGLKHLPSKFPFIIATNHRFSTWSLTLLVAYFYSELNRKIYVITKEEICKLLGEKARSDAIILHSLPRMDELPPDVDSTRHARYWEEAFNGVVMRMALLALIMGAME